MAKKLCRCSDCTSQRYPCHSRASLTIIRSTFVREGGAGKGGLPIVEYTGRLRPKGVLFQDGRRYIEGRDLSKYLEQTQRKNFPLQVCERVTFPASSV